MSVKSVKLNLGAAAGDKYKFVNHKIDVMEQHQNYWAFIVGLITTLWSVSSTMLVKVQLW